MPVRDILIIGGGPSGLSAAIAAKQRGLDYQVSRRRRARPSRSGRPRLPRRGERPKRSSSGYPDAVCRLVGEHSRWRQPDESRCPCLALREPQPAVMGATRSFKNPRVAGLSGSVFSVDDCEVRPERNRLLWCERVHASVVSQIDKGYGSCGFGPTNRQVLRGQRHGLL